jgi:hypothetical protein
MAFNRLAGGHRFDFNRMVCLRCGMSRKKFEDRGRPWCTGQSPGKREPLSRNPEDDPPPTMA